MKKEYFTADSGLAVHVTDTQVEEVYTLDLSNRLIAFVNMLPNDVQAMSQDVPGLVQTSINNAVLREEDGKVVLQTSLRSSVASQLEHLADQVRMIATANGATFKRNNDYPSWNFEPLSNLRQLCLDVYKEVYGKEATYDAIYAGLECGFLKGALPNCDMISYGPNVYDVHSTKEHIEIDSVERVWNYTKELLAKMK